MILYRGTQTPEVKGHLKSASYTPSLPAAIIYSARPGPWGTDPEFLSTSTVHIARLETDKILELSPYADTSFQDILRLLRYEKKNGIDIDEAVKILQYMHNRILGRTQGGEFKYKVVDDFGHELDPDDVPFSLTMPETLISQFKDDFELEQSIDEAETSLVADSFIFADAPAVGRAARKLGYEAIKYPDVFAGAEGVSEKLLGIPVDRLQGIREEEDIDYDPVPMHDTIRTLVEGAVVPVESIPTLKLLKRLDKADLEQPGEEEEVLA